MTAKALDLLERTSRTETLVVVTADHGHPLTISGYAKRAGTIRRHG